MRNLILSSSLLVVLVALPLAAQDRAFPWRARSRRAPAPPRMEITPFFASATLQDDQDGAAAKQNSSGIGLQLTDQDLDQVPQAPQTPQDTSTQPPLSVASNAISESDYCNRDRGPRCCLGDPISLFGTTANGFHIGGWTQWGYHNRNNIMFNNRQGEFQLHQGWLYLDKQATGGSNWGYRMDVVYGIDGPDLQAFGNAPTGAPSGWDNSWDFGSYGWAIPQAYLEFGGGSNSTLRIGKFLSPFGYEGLPAVENFFYSRTFTRYYIEPFSNTGMIAEVQQSPNSALLFGVTAGWDTAFDNNDHGFNLITGMRRQLSDNVRVYSTAALGDMGARGSGTLTSIIADVRLGENANYVSQFDMLNLNTNNVDEFSFINYLFYHFSPCFGIGTRLEWWKSDQLFTSTRSTWDWTIGANYRPHANVVIRPEVRVDWGAGAVDPGQGIIGLDAIITF